MENTEKITTHKQMAI